HLGERDCTVQRNHQKLIEESPAPVLDAEERARTLAAAVEATRRIGYVGAGTIEFLLDQSGDGGQAGVLRFMEMNTRLQVEHCVSEMRSGVDLVREQIMVAAGCPLSLSQDAIGLRGHAIECRINAEDPSQNFRPSPGVITRWDQPAPADDLRIDTHVRAGYEVPPFYDSLLCKVISWGETRDAAADRMIAALSQLHCEGVATTIPMHLQILASADFRANTYDTRAIPGWAGAGH
ncbi:MAG: acetyl-CoA carboxylase biotin carboxylase subunit, partial [Myxococcales bacterium]|nr:acetyl-CoA carboxylase biotin carboxylase subunit [Myxococcales bacterium]